MEKVINILGTEYQIIFKKYNEDENFRNCAGYCSNLTREIVICDMSTYPGWENETDVIYVAETKRLLRHEIIHGFLYQSGLNGNTNSCEYWSTNEEMVDWIALQFPKMAKVFQAAGCLE